jgi:hypothetical protein
MFYKVELICHHPPHQCRCRHNIATEVDPQELTNNLISIPSIMQDTIPPCSSISPRKIPPPHKYHQYHSKKNQFKSQLSRLPIEVLPKKKAYSLF